MSILLDALKRSEEQRQLGGTPSIHGPADRQSEGGAAAQQWVPVTLMAVSAIAMAWIGWQQFRLPEPVAAPVTVSVAPPVVAPERPPGTAPSEALVAVAEEAASPARDVSDGGEQDARRTPVETLRSSGASLQGVTVMPPQDSQPPQPRKSRVSQSFTAFEAAAQDPSPEQQEAAPSEAPDSLPGGAPPEEPDRLPGVAGEPSLATEPISFWELPQGIRDDLPEMRITVLVYAESPEDRFLLMGGQRMVEKDEYQEGVVLEEIRRDGAVFLYRKYRFLVKG